MKKLLLSALAVVLSACAVNPKPQLTRDEWVNLTTRHYAGISVNDSLNAAEKLMRLADGDDFNVSYTEDGLYASRQWTVYLVFAAAMGNDNWLVKARPDSDGVTISIQVSTLSGAVTPLPTAQGDISVSSTPSLGGPPVQGTALYTLFWSRLDYLLGKSGHWVDCAEFYTWEKERKVWGTGESLCNSFNIADTSPVPGVEERKRLERELADWEKHNESWRTMPEHLKKFKEERAKDHRG